MKFQLVLDPHHQQCRVITLDEMGVLEMSSCLVHSPVFALAHHNHVTSCDH